MLLRLEAFLGSWDQSLPRICVPFTPRPPGAVFPTPISGLHVWPPSSVRGVDLPLCVSPSLCFGGSGILTGCPSPTLLSLGLGPTDPTRTDLPSEPLGFRRIRFSRISRYSCQHSHSCDLHRSSRYGFFDHTTLPYQTAARAAASVASVVSFSPVTFSAQNRLTSELLRTL
jgi:hypothetical protein